MIIRLSEKLASKLKIENAEMVSIADDPLADWSAHLFTVERVQYVIYMNTTTLYSILFPGVGVTTERVFLRQARSALTEYLADGGYLKFTDKILARMDGKLIYSKALNRSVTGSMNDMIHLAKVYLSRSGHSMVESTFKVNEAPMSALKYESPAGAFKKLVNESIAE